MDYHDFRTHPLPTLLSAAVPLWIRRIQDAFQRGDLDQAALTREVDGLRDFAQTLGAEGDKLLFRGGKPGEAAALFNRTAHAIALLSFVPGGITIMGSHWETDADPA
jgi:hypothetical protein